MLEVFFTSLEPEERNAWKNKIYCQALMTQRLPANLKND